MKIGEDRTWPNVLRNEPIQGEQTKFRPSARLAQRLFPIWTLRIVETLHSEVAEDLLERPEEGRSSLRLASLRIGR